MKNLFELLSKHGGKIVSTNDLREYEIKQAIVSKRIFVDEDSLGYVWLPPFHDRWPASISEIKMTIWCYPLEVELPESVNLDSIKKEFMNEARKTQSKL
jgi:hypothetical protein